MLDENIKITVEFTRDELELIYRVFSGLTSEHLERWTELISMGQFKTERCEEQWLLTGMYHEVMCQVGEAIGMRVHDITDDVVRIMPFEIYKKFIEKND